MNNYTKKIVLVKHENEYYAFVLECYSYEEYVYHVYRWFRLRSNSHLYENIKLFSEIFLAEEGVLTKEGTLLSLAKSSNGEPDFYARRVFCNDKLVREFHFYYDEKNMFIPDWMMQTIQEAKKV